MYRDVEVGVIRYGSVEMEFVPRVVAGEGNWDGADGRVRMVSSACEIVMIRDYVGRKSAIIDGYVGNETMEILLLGSPIFSTSEN